MDQLATGVADRGYKVRALALAQLFLFLLFIKSKPSSINMKKKNSMHVFTVIASVLFSPAFWNIKPLQLSSTRPAHAPARTHTDKDNEYVISSRHRHQPKGVLPHTPCAAAGRIHPHIRMLCLIREPCSCPESQRTCRTRCSAFYPRTPILPSYPHRALTSLIINNTFQVIKKLGKGAQGAVWLVHHKDDPPEDFHVLKKVECNDEGEASKAFQEVRKGSLQGVKEYHCIAMPCIAVHVCILHMCGA